MQPDNKVCVFFLKGNCKYGDKCNNSHGNNNSNPKQGNNFSKPNSNFQNNQGYQNNNKPFNNGQNYNNPNNKFGNNQVHGNNQGQGNNSNYQGKNFNPGFNKNNHFNNNSASNFNNNKFDNNHFENKNKPSTSKMCDFFTKPSGCKRGDTCHFLHNYHENLHHIKREAIHQANIVGCTTTSKPFKHKYFIKIKLTKISLPLLKTELSTFSKSLLLSALSQKKLILKSRDLRI